MTSTTLGSLREVRFARSNAVLSSQSGSKQCPYRLNSEFSLKPQLTFGPSQRFFCENLNATTEYKWGLPPDWTTQLTFAVVPHSLPFRMTTSCFPYLAVCQVVICVWSHNDPWHWAETVVSINHNVENGTSLFGYISRESPNASKKFRYHGYLEFWMALQNIQTSVNCK